jgi:hypothetical protein
MLIGLVLAVATAAGPALARDRDSRLPDAVRRVERETNGQILRAEQMRSGNRQVSRIKVLTPDGRVRVLRGDPGAAATALRPPPRDEPGVQAQELPPRDDGRGRQD